MPAIETDPPLARKAAHWTLGPVGAEKPVEEGFVDRGEPCDVADIDALVGLVHRLADQAEFGDRAIAPG